MYIGGVSTRKASKIVEGMCGFEVSAQMVSNTSKDLDARLTAWRNRSLGQMEYLFVERYSKSMPKISQWAENNIPEGLTVFGLDLCEFNRKRLRTSNMIERLNQTVKQRTKAAKIFANEESCLRLISAIVMEVSEQWVGGRMYLRVK